MLKSLFPWPDTVSMEKRAMLWMVGLIGFGFTFLAAVNVKEPSPYTLSGYSTSCSGFGHIDNWTSSSCSDSFPSRLGVMALGLIILVVCGYFAEKGQSRPTTVPRHFVRRDPRDDLYWCTTCGQSTFVRNEALAHIGLHPGATCTFLVEAWAARGRPARPDNSSVVKAEKQPTMQSASDVAVKTAAVAQTSELKTCPDCAEEVKAAARKCRFCGFLFTPVPAG